MKESLLSQKIEIVTHFFSLLHEIENLLLFLSYFSFQSAKETFKMVSDASVTRQLNYFFNI